MSDPLRNAYGPGRDPEQAWFWDPAWQAGEREASAQIKAGDTTTHPDADSMFTALTDGACDIRDCPGCQCGAVPAPCMHCTDHWPDTESS